MSEKRIELPSDDENAPSDAEWAPEKRTQVDPTREEIASGLVDGSMEKFGMKKLSAVWQHYMGIREVVSNQVMPFVTCNYCQMLLSHIPKNGTSHLTAHMRTSCRGKPIEAVEEPIRIKRQRTSSGRPTGASSSSTTLPLRSSTAFNQYTQPSFLSSMTYKELIKVVGVDPETGLTSWRKAIDHSAETVVFFQVDLRGIVPKMSKSVRISREKTSAGFRLIPSVYVGDTLLSWTYVETVIGRKYLADEDDLMKLLEHAGVLAVDQLIGEVPEEKENDYPDQGASEDDPAWLEPEFKKARYSKNATAMFANDPVDSVPEGHEDTFSELEEAGDSASLLPSVYHDEDSAGSDTAVDFETLDFVESAIAGAPGKSHCQRPTKKVTSTLVDVPGKIVHLQKKVNKRQSTATTKKTINSLLKGGGPQVACPKLELLKKLRHSWSTPQHDTVELFPGSCTFVSTAGFDDFKTKLHPKKAITDAADLAVLVCGGRENVLALFTGDGFGLKQAVGDKILRDMTMYINCYHPGIAAKKILPIMEKDLVSAFGKKLYNWRQNFPGLTNPAPATS